jgi:uncharacterized protein with PQ loop repeat
MEKIIFQNIGFIGALISISAYFPQITHLIKVKNSTGVNPVSLFIWLFGNLMVLVYSFYINDIVFIILAILEGALLITTIFLSIKYKNKQI